MITFEMAKEYLDDLKAEALENEEGKILTSNLLIIVEPIIRDEFLKGEKKAVEIFKNDILYFYCKKEISEKEALEILFNKMVIREYETSKQTWTKI